MLACGEFLIIPVPPKPLSERPVERCVEPTPPIAPADPAAEAQAAEPRSFLLILLRALGAIHT